MPKLESSLPPTRLDTPCAEWEGTKNDRGYGVRKVRGKQERAHRLAWKEVHGPIPPGLVVMHLCDNPPCCRVDHLRLGTIAENNADMVAKGRSRGGAPGGEQHGCAKLSWRDVNSVRALYAGGGWTQQELASEFHMSREAISKIIRHKTWQVTP